MNNNSEAQPTEGAPVNRIKIKIFGVGNAGLAMLDQMLQSGFSGADFIGVNTDATSLATSLVSEKVHLETRQLRGLGTGGDPDRARTAAEEAEPKLKAMC